MLISFKLQLLHVSLTQIIHPCEAVPDDQPVDPALLLPLDHCDHPQVDRYGGDQHGYVRQKVDHRGLIDCLGGANTEC